MKRRRPPLPLWGLLALLAGAGCSPIEFVISVGEGRGELDETTVVAERDAKAKVALVDVSGLIVNAEPNGLLIEPGGENPLSLLHEQLDKAAADDDVKAVLLRINSPGGGVLASQAMHDEVTRFKRRTGKPVVAVLMDVAASGGYYVACAADTVVAYPSTVTGSIGVVIQTVGVGPALARFGVETEALTSGPNKDAGNPLGSLDDGERATLQAVVDDFYAQFVDVVRASRPGLDGADLAEATDGRVVSGTRALELGLVDALGTVYDAFAAAKDAASLRRADLVRYHRPLAETRSPYATASAGVPRASLAGDASASVDLVPDAVDLPGGFYYLWRPGLN